jgi:hypothetical protein
MAGSLPRYWLLGKLPHDAMKMAATTVIAKFFILI